MTLLDYFSTHDNGKRIYRIFDDLTGKMIWPNRHNDKDRDWLLRRDVVATEDCGKYIAVYISL